MVSLNVQENVLNNINILRLSQVFSCLYPVKQHQDIKRKKIEIGKYKLSIHWHLQSFYYQIGSVSRIPADPPPDETIVQSSSSRHA